ncbi:MAG: hypothetical protein AAGE52_21200 [Myxococcota bacterium]
MKRVLLWVVIAACGDSSSSELIVDVRTDFVPGVEFTAVRTRVGDVAPQTRTAFRMDADSFLRAARVAEFDDISTGVEEVIVELLDSAGGTLATRRVSASVDGVTGVTVVFTRNCSNVRCPEPGGDPAATECIDAQCVPPSCSPETPEACGAATCSDASDCEGEELASCARRVCRERVCLVERDDSSCEAGFFCDPERDCVELGGSDAGVVDAGAMDASGGCTAGEPCERANPCERGITECADGVTQCVAAGPAPAGTTCRPPDGDCDAADECDGTSTECPDAFLPNETVCRDPAGPCELPAVCDGTQAACPDNARRPLGESCDGGFCNGVSAMCQDDCVPGAECSTGNVCVVGELDCSSGSPVCVAAGNVPDGASCDTDEVGPWGSCTGFSSACDNGGVESRSVMEFECVAGTCRTASRTETRACSRDTDGDSCGTTETTAWTSCSGFSGTCGESGTQSRTVTSFECSSGSCSSISAPETRGCSRDTDGITCAMTNCGPYTTCGSFSDTCDEMGTQSRTCTDFACAGGSCGSSSRSDSRSCSRDTDGTSCGMTTTGPWGPCFGGSGCTGIESRTRTTFTCGSAMCMSNDSTEQRSCMKPAGSGCSASCGGTRCFGECDSAGNCNPI